MGIKKSKGARSWDLNNDLDKFFQETGTPDPGRFLAELMAGQDPRSDTSQLWQLFNDNENKDVPSKRVWQQAKDIVLGDDRYRRDFVSSEESARAAKTLMDFLYAKKKSVEISGHLTASIAITKPLTIEEIEKFEEKFCDEY